MATEPVEQPLLPAFPARPVFDGGDITELLYRRQLQPQPPVHGARPGAAVCRAHPKQIPQVPRVSFRELGDGRERGPAGCRDSCAAALPGTGSSRRQSGSSCTASRPLLRGSARSLARSICPGCCCRLRGGGFDVTERGRRCPLAPLDASTQNSVAAAAPAPVFRLSPQLHYQRPPAPPECGGGLTTAVKSKQVLRMAAADAPGLPV